MPKHYDKIRSLGACDPGLDWLKDQDNTWYDKCERGDWLAWLVGKICDRKRLVLCLCDIAESVQHLDQSGKGRIVIDTVRRWCNGEATLEEVKTAAVDAAYAAYAAARATAYAARAARTAYAVHAADYAADAARAAARAESLKQFANIARDHFPWSEVEAKLDELTKGVE